MPFESIFHNPSQFQPETGVRYHFEKDTFLNSKIGTGNWPRLYCQRANLSANLQIGSQRIGTKIPLPPIIGKLPFRYPLVGPHHRVLDIDRMVAHPAEHQRLVQRADHEHRVVVIYEFQREKINIPMERAPLSQMTNKSKMRGCKQDEQHQGI